MDQLREVAREVDIPKNTGVEGFVMTLRELLRLSRVQEIVIDAKGKIRYKRLIRDGEDTALNIDLETVTPMGVFKRAHVEELVVPPQTSAAIAIGKMLDRFAIDQVRPLLFVSGPGTVFWEWYRVTTKSAIHYRGSVFGFPFLLEHQIPDTALLLFGTATTSTSLIDATHVLKLEMETSILKPPADTVEVL